MVRRGWSEVEILSNSPKDVARAEVYSGRGVTVGIVYYPLLYHSPSLDICHRHVTAHHSQYIDARCTADHSITQNHTLRWGRSRALPDTVGLGILNRFKRTLYFAHSFSTPSIS